MATKTKEPHRPPVPLSEETARSRRTAILICGMHRCGTSALARVLNILGASLPLDIYPAGPGNELGHWEPSDSGPLHDAILSSMGTHWASLVPGNERWLESDIPQNFRTQIRELILRQYGNEALFVVKDPRLSLVLPLWIDVLKDLEIDPVIIVASRNPIEVAESLARRHDAGGKAGSWPLDRGGLLWLRYMLAAERHTRGLPRAFYDYADILDDWRATITRLSMQLNVVWPRWSATAENEIDAFLTLEMRHHSSQKPVTALGSIWEDWIGPVYLGVTRARVTQDINEDLFDQIGAAVSSSLRYFGRYIAEVEAKQASAAQSEVEVGRLEAMGNDHRRQIESLNEDIRRAELERKSLEQGSLALGERLDHVSHQLQSLLEQSHQTRAERDAAVLERDAAEARAHALARQLLARAKEIEQLKSEVGALAPSSATKLAHETSANANDGELDIRRLQAELALARVKNGELARTVQEMRSSFSWRCTRPVRSLRSRFPQMAEMTRASVRSLARLWR